jgi:hypothetical protein
MPKSRAPCIRSCRSFGFAKSARFSAIEICQEMQNLTQTAAQSLLAASFVQWKKHQSSTQHRIL